MVSEKLEDEQWVRWVHVYVNLVNRIQAEPNFLDNSITRDETWIFQYDPESKKQNE
jgi:hypothetical protein